MIAYDELVNTLAAWRARQGMAETGADFLGPMPPFPEYRVAAPSQEAAEPIDDNEVVYEDAAEDAYAYEEEATAIADGDDISEAPYEYEAASEETGEPAGDEVAGAEAYAMAAEEEAEQEAYEIAAQEVEEPYEVLEEEAQSEEELSVADTGPLGDETIEADYAVSYDDDQDEAEPAEVVVAEGSTDDLADDDEGPTAFNQDPLYAADESTQIGTGIDQLAPGEASGNLDNGLEDAISTVPIEEDDSVSYASEDDEERD